MNKRHPLSAAIAAAMCAGMLVLAACSPSPQNQSAAPAAPASSASAPAPQQAYTPPTADQLYQMVAPIALYPDKLVAQVLAGATYPDQVSAAENLVTQNPNLKGDLLQAAVQPQNWDPSVKGLTQFPSVLGQMAQNIPWTTALGEAYVNDPTDVLNAIQVMRQRARANGNLRSSAQQSVAVQPTQQAQAGEQASYVDNGSAPPGYGGAGVVPQPQQVIQIDPAQADEVYVPSYDPQTVYGGDTPVYPDYQYRRPSFSTGDVVMVGAVAFGAGILVSSLLHHDHHDNGYAGGDGDGDGGGGGWQSWGMDWGGGDRNGDGGGGERRPAVVYNNQTYVSRSTTVVNRYTNNVTNNRYINNSTVNNSTVNNNVTNNVINRQQAFNHTVTNNVSSNRPQTPPIGTNRFARAGVPVPHAAPQAPPPVLAHPAVAPSPAPLAPNPAPRPTLAREAPVARAAVHPAPVPAPAAAPRPQPAFRQPVAAPHPAPPPPPQPAAHPAPVPQPRAAAPSAPAPQPHPAPVVHPAPAPAPHPAPAAAHPASPAPAPQAHPQPQARPAPGQHPQNGHKPPEKKKDETHG